MRPPDEKTLFADGFAGGEGQGGEGGGRASFGRRDLNHGSPCIDLHSSINDA